MDGVLATRVGYTGGAEAYPTYERIGGHTEAVQVEYDPSRVSYAQLLDAVWASGAPRRGLGAAPATRGSRGDW